VHRLPQVSRLSLSLSLILILPFSIRAEQKLKFLLPTITEKDTRYRPNQGKHHEECRLFTHNELVAQNLDRSARKEISTNPLVNPMQAWEQGQQKALKMTAELGENSKDPDAVANAFPSYEQVRKQMHRRRKEACRAIKDPFQLPPAFQQTYRASVTGEEER